MMNYRHFFVYVGVILWVSESSITQACATGHPLTYFSGLKPSNASCFTALADILKVHDVAERGNEGGSADGLVGWTILLGPQPCQER